MHTPSRGWAGSTSPANIYLYSIQQPGENRPNHVLFRNENVKWSPDLEYIVAIEHVANTGVRQCRRLLTVIAVGGEACVGGACKVEFDELTIDKENAHLTYCQSG
jgi:hypothetical protein